ncbi:hypothetical protein [Mycobacterium sp.]|uniref:hypothetical protein n=1 Tax=Mycobacterium sp. TaxID=1785 RepID=UPI0025E14F10|nr:hypothetical protein [Mycobacterium sp.]
MGTASAWPASTARAAFCVEEVGLAPKAAVSTIGAHHFHDTDVAATDCGGQSGTV